MRVVYDLQKDSAQIERAQDATLNSKQFGVQQTHGLFGSKEWWSKIASGELKTHKIRGRITQVYMGSMGDWPEFEVEESDGGKSQWTREVNRAEDDSFYVVGNRVEIDYVVQHLKETSFLSSSETKCVIQIRIEA